ncbi:MAG: bifunctional demethylmenaquinone methyltransferase/2-methoxy-6-polyprenyl-1,4-benzoquinol methylase UbiE [Alistipes sp.]|nr:bifunctional demethylmenaquinone methyltransferase/2-methoxy-6-polyprenyl-1,4-benzoquinol methylase UbiE [Alistipes sp.]MDE7129569.1 bifunctional demethylmenaquinone methyltransferase/2-methoxy-6-polyprenyl-1,4-benzoquinol methylase UbiE [Alistipes sp.]
MKPYNQEQTKKQQVEQMFDNIASTYDGLNHILSFNIDRLWRRRVVRIVRGTGAKRIMDMATGTGDLAIAMAKRIPGSHILGVDLSRKMLDVAQNKIRRQGLDERIILQHGDAERLDAVASESLDAVTVAFGVRNFDDLAGGLQQIHRTIRPGGTLVVLEFSTPRNRAIRWFYAQYSHRLLPQIGGLVSKDKRAYVYLPESVDEFPSPERFCDLLGGAGFCDVTRHSLSCGIAHIYVARRAPLTE